MENFTTNDVYLQQIRNRSDIVNIQEHWLFTFEKHKLIDFCSDNGFNCLIKCCDEFEPISPKIRTRGHGGSGILWKKYLDPFVTKLDDGCERICAIQVESTNKPLCIISAYMPTSGGTQSDNQYRTCLDELSEIVTKYDFCNILLAGDLNASFNRLKPTARDKLFYK